MRTFAIVRQDGECDQAEGASVQDVADRFGWPGNGTIEAWDAGKHDGSLRHRFLTVEDQRAKLDPDYVAPPTAQSEAEAFDAAVQAAVDRRLASGWQPGATPPETEPETVSPTEDN